MDYLELLFANKVRELANAKRHNAKIAYQDSQPNANLLEWKKQNPDTKFVKLALTEIMEIAEFIREQKLEQTSVPHQEESLGD